MVGEGGYRRRSARVLVVDGVGRVLLLRFLGKRNYFWLTPGGGVHDGETLRQAAAREAKEEIGLVVAEEELGRPVAYTAGYVELDWASGVFRDDYFFYRVDEFDVDTSGMEEFERGKHGGHRWWSVAELRATADVVYPVGLAGLVADLLEGRVGESIRLPWR